jgi:RNA polymerase sigma factor (sigma-70 family)
MSSQSTADELYLEQITLSALALLVKLNPLTGELQWEADVENLLKLHLDSARNCIRRLRPELVSQFGSTGADDVLTKALAKTFRKFKPELGYKFETYFKRVSRTTVIDYYRSHRYDVADPEILVAIPAETEDPSRPENPFHEAGFEKYLSPEEIEVLLLKDLKMTYEEMSRVLGRSVSSLKSKASRAHEKMRGLKREIRKDLGYD